MENGTLIIKARKKEGHVGLWKSLGNPVDRKCDPAVKTRREESIKEKLKQEQEVRGGSNCICVKHRYSLGPLGHNCMVNTKTPKCHGQCFVVQQQTRET